MRFKQKIMQQSGVLLLLVVSVGSLWLSVQHTLNLYIHPRYVVFTTIMSVLSVVLAVMSYTYKNVPKKQQNKRTLQDVGIGMLLLLTFTGLLVIKPATLTTTVASQRGINTAITTSRPTTNAVPLFSGNDYKSFGVQDWASLLAQTSSPSFYEGKSVDIVGFITPDANDPQNIFFVSRFVITCCAVDARPIGVPVYMPGWQNGFKADQWVNVVGSFAANPSASSTYKVAVQNAKVEVVGQPKDPYVY